MGSAGGERGYDHHMVDGRKILCVVVAYGQRRQEGGYALCGEETKPKIYADRTAARHRKTEPDKGADERAGTSGGARSDVWIQGRRRADKQVGVACFQVVFCTSGDGEEASVFDTISVGVREVDGGLAISGLYN